MGLKPMPVQGKTCAKEKMPLYKGVLPFRRARYGISCRARGRFCTGGGRKRFRRRPPDGVVPHDLAERRVRVCWTSL